jgi:hypothetical protein
MVNVLAYTDAVSYYPHLIGGRLLMGRVVHAEDRGPCCLEGHVLGCVGGSVAGSGLFVDFFVRARSCQEMAGNEV